MTDKQPSSQMIRVPTALIESVRELSRLHREGHTQQILEGLQLLISAIDISSDINPNPDINPDINSDIRTDINSPKIDISSDIKSNISLISGILERLERLEKGAESREIQPDISPDIAPISGILERLEQVEEAVARLEQSHSMHQASTPALTGEGWLTTGEAFQIAQEKGWQGSNTTFRRRLEGGTMPPDLEQLGLEADFDRRNAGPSRSNSIRWLRYQG